MYFFTSTREKLILNLMCDCTPVTCNYYREKFSVWKVFGFIFKLHLNLIWKVCDGSNIALNFFREICLFVRLLNIRNLIYLRRFLKDFQIEEKIVRREIGENRFSGWKFNFLIVFLAESTICCSYGQFTGFNIQFEARIH